MGKETFYFSHDYNARADRKLVNVIMKHGMQGIGVYWCLVEMLYEEGGYMPTEYERISFELRTDTKVIQSIILDYELFKTDADKFWSDAVLDRLRERCEKSEKARESINKRWQKIKDNTNVIRTNEDRNTIKESKGEESKVKKPIYSDFYDSQIAISGDNENYIRVVKALYGENNIGVPLTVLLKMPTQLSFAQFEKIWYLKEKYKFSIIQIFEKMQDWGNPKKRTTIYNTFLTFAKNEKPEIKC
jgi:hypothetical protein